MPNQQKQIFFIVLLALIFVIGGAGALYYWFNNDTANAKREQVLKNIDKSNQDFLNMLEKNRVTLDALSTSTPTTTPSAPTAQPDTATSSDPSTPTL